jgi:hypothetical protein
MYTTGGSWASERSWTVNDAEGNLVASGSSTTWWEGCLRNGDYTVTGVDSYGDGWNGGVFTVQGPGGIIASIDLVPSGTTGSAEFEIDIDYSIVYGCTDDTAVNYNVDATEDDGSCYYVGDVCASPNPSTGAAVSGGAFGWYEFDLPATEGILSISTDDPFSTLWVVVDCNYSTSSYDYYDGIIAYQSGTATMDYVFSTENTNFGGAQSTDAYLNTRVLVWASGYIDGTDGEGNVSISYADFTIWLYRSKQFKL